MRPADDLEPLQRMDPLTRGSLFHAMQTAFYRQLQREDALPVTPGRPRSRAGGARRGGRGDRRRAVRAAGAGDRSRVARRDRARSGAICACGWTRSPAPAANGFRRRFEWAFGYADGGALAVGRDPDEPGRAGRRSTAASSSTARSISSRSARAPASCASPITRPGSTAARTT